MYNAFAMQDNVLDNELKIQQASALQEARRQNALNAFASGVKNFVDEPARAATRDNKVKGQENALASQNLDREAKEREMVSGLLEGVERAPEHLRPQAWQHARSEAQRMRLDLDGIPEQYDPEFFQILQAGLEREGIEMPASVQEYIFARDQGGFDGGFLDWRQQSARGAGDKPTTGMREYEFAQEQGFPGTFQQWKELNRSKGMEITSDGKGGFTITQGGGTGERKERKLTERQSQLTLFGNQMEKMAPVLDDLELRFDPTNIPDAAATAMGTFGNFIRSEEKQRYEAAANAWAEGVLRIQTGAAATQPEIERVVRTYFASPGDDPETVKFKRELRDGFFKSVEAASGGVFQEGDSEPLGGTQEQFDATRDIDGTTYVQKNGKWFVKP